MDKINNKRIEVWNTYDEFFKKFDGKIRRPVIPCECKHNAHMYYILMNDLKTRTEFISFMKQNGINPVFHYIPLHSSPAGRKYCRTLGDMEVTNLISDTLVRLPMFYELNHEKISYITLKAEEFLISTNSKNF